MNTDFLIQETKQKIKINVIIFKTISILLFVMSAIIIVFLRYSEYFHASIFFQYKDCDEKVVNNFSYLCKLPKVNALNLTKIDRKYFFNLKGVYFILCSFDLLNFMIFLLFINYMYCSKLIYLIKLGLDFMLFITRTIVLDRIINYYKEYPSLSFIPQEINIYRIDFYIRFLNIFIFFSILYFYKVFKEHGELRLWYHGEYLGNKEMIN